MLIPHLHFSGDCYQAIKAYVRAFNATLNDIVFIDKGEPEKGVLHAEILMHGQRVVLNDNRSDNSLIDFPSAQLVVVFDNENELKYAFDILKDGGKVVSPMHSTDFTECTVGFWDRYGIRWGFMVQ